MENESNKTRIESDRFTISKGRSIQIDLNALMCRDPDVEALVNAWRKLSEDEQQRQICIPLSAKWLACLPLPRDHVRQRGITALKKLQHCGVGKFTPGRRGKDTRLALIYDTLDYRVLCDTYLEFKPATSDSGSTDAANARPSPSEHETLQDTDMLEHRFRLRREIELRLNLPANLTGQEAERLSGFIRTLPLSVG